VPSLFDVDNGVKKELSRHESDPHCRNDKLQRTDLTKNLVGSVLRCMPSAKCGVGCQVCVSRVTLDISLYLKLIVYGLGHNLCSSASLVAW
jgi:hypothetical protein